jgi:hypothetical protein
MPEKLPQIFTMNHPLVDKEAEGWEENERRARGGRDVLVELRPFDWESMPFGGDEGDDPWSKSIRDELSIKDIAEILAAGAIRPGDHYRFRQRMAVYMNFPEMFSTTMVGALMGRRPVPGGDLNFGMLGGVRRRGRSADPNQAELVYFNTDGVGNDGSQWDNYWAGAIRRAMATGHRWIYVDSAAQPALDREVLTRRGGRPYITDFSALAAVNWIYELGQLSMIIFRVPSRRVTLGNGELLGNDGTTDYLVMTRRGFDALGPTLGRGGWWLVDQEGTVIRKGNWAKTGGDIPVFPLYYQRSYPIVNAKGEWDHQMSQSATSELGNAAVSYMNLSSAADFDAWDAAASIQFLRGVDEDGWRIAMKILRLGSKYVPLPAVLDSEGRGTVPIAQDVSMGAVTSTVFDMALKRKLDEVSRLAATQATQAPDSSGLSKSAGFAEAKVPRLALLASEVEAAQNTAIYFLERRFGYSNPTGQVVWTRKFNLVQLSEDIEAYFTLEKLSGMKSKTLDSKALILAAREKGLMTDDDGEAAKILGEYMASALAADLKNQQTATGGPTTASGTGLSGADPAAKVILDGKGGGDNAE